MSINPNFFFLSSSFFMLLIGINDSKETIAPNIPPIPEIKEAVLPSCSYEIKHKIVAAREATRHNVPKFIQSICFLFILFFVNNTYSLLFYKNLKHDSHNKHCCEQIASSYFLKELSEACFIIVSSFIGSKARSYKGRRNPQESQGFQLS